MPLSAAVILLSLRLVLPTDARQCPRECRCDGTKLSVTCFGRNLTQIPQAVDEETLKLDLRNNNLQMLPRAAFVHTPYLTHLNLQRCSIHTVKEGAFRALGRLVSLNLAYNRMVILYQESFDGLSSLKELHLEHNLIEEIQPGAFTQLGFLNMLSLSDNQLVYIPNMAFQGLQNIKWLRLSHNSLNNLAPEAFAALFTLGRLSLDHNELQFFPTQSMTRLQGVTRLDLSHNPMIYLGEESVSMAKLTHLYLDHMSLQDLSDQALSGSPLLSHLDLSHNQLHYLEPLSGPKQLSSLNLSGNPLDCNCYLRPLREWARARRLKLHGTCAGPAHLSDEQLLKVSPVNLRCRSRTEVLGEKEQGEEDVRSTQGSPPSTTTKPKPKVKCPLHCECDIKTQHATCEGRGFTKVPRGFPLKTQLLDLRSNLFHHLPASSFLGAAHIVSLHLELCKIRGIEDGAFQGMKELLYLYLSDNHITSLGRRAFSGLPQLTYLHLEGNRLTQFPRPALSLLPHLFVLHLERNSISKVEPAYMLSSGNPELRELYLGHNNVTSVAQGAFSSTSLGTLHLDSNRLTAVPTSALLNTPNLEELSLSKNPIRWIGPKAFQSISQSLKRVYLDKMGMEKMSRDALFGLGSALQTLTMSDNQLKELPDFSPLSRLEALDLQDNPLHCSCLLLPLRRWMDNVGSEVMATCAHPPELRGKKVKDFQNFKSCPENGSHQHRKVAVDSGPQKTKESKARPSKSPKVKTKAAKQKSNLTKLLGRKVTIKKKILKLRTN